MVRYRRGDEVATPAALADAGHGDLARRHGALGLVAGTPVVVLLAIPLIPAAVTVAIVRHQLLDIRLVVSRALSWVLLSLAVLVTYVALVTLLDRLISAQLGRSAAVTVILVLVAAPVLPRLQRLVDRAMYGDRGNPAQRGLGGGLPPGHRGHRSEPGSRRGRTALRLPYAALQRDAHRAGQRRRAAGACAVALTYGGKPVGELVLGLRSGERVLSSADRKALQVLAAPMAVAVAGDGDGGRTAVLARTHRRRRRRRSAAGCAANCTTGWGRR